LECFFNHAKHRKTFYREKSIDSAMVRPDLRDVFLCQARDDRQEAAKELHDALESRGVSVWFSEKDGGLDTVLLRSAENS